jgi:trafficking protein particle complex subunit 12
MRLFNQASAECANLFTLLDTIEPKEIRHHIYEQILPFELEVFRTRLPLWANDPLGYLDVLHALLSKCKRNVREAKETALVDTWEERCARITLIIASQLIDMKVWHITAIY